MAMLTSMDVKAATTKKIQKTTVTKQGLDSTEELKKLHKRYKKDYDASITYVDYLNKILADEIFLDCENAVRDKLLICALNYVEDYSLKHPILPPANAKASENGAILPNNISMSAVGYSSSSSISYATYWYNKWDMSYPSYSSDCTNFVSRCLRAGGYGNTIATPKISSPSTNVMKQTTSNWYSFSKKFTYQTPPYIRYGYYTCTSFVRVKDFKSYWSKRRTTYTYSNTDSGRKNLISKIRPGDVVIWLNSSGSGWHTTLCTKRTSSEAYLTYRTNNRLNYPLKSLKSHSNISKFYLIKFV